MLPWLDAALLRLGWWEVFFVGCLEGDLDIDVEEAFTKDPSPIGYTSSCSTSLDGGLLKRLDACLEFPGVDFIVFALGTSPIMDDDLTLVTLDLLVTLLLKLLSSLEMSSLVDCRRKVCKLPSPLAALSDACRGPVPSVVLLLVLRWMFKDRDIRFT